MCKWFISWCLCSCIGCNTQARVHYWHMHAINLGILMTKYFWCWLLSSEVKELMKYQAEEWKCYHFLLCELQNRGFFPYKNIEILVKTLYRCLIVYGHCMAHQIIRPRNRGYKKIMLSSAVSMKFILLINIL